MHHPLIGCVIPWLDLWSPAWLSKSLGWHLYSSYWPPHPLTKYHTPRFAPKIPSSDPSKLRLVLTTSRCHWTFTLFVWNSTYWVDPHFPMGSFFKSSSSGFETPWKALWSLDTFSRLQSIIQLPKRLSLIIMYLFQSILLDLLYCHFNESLLKINRNDSKGRETKYVY